MKLKTIFSSVQWINLGLLVLNVLNQWGALFPNLDAPPWVLKVQVLLGILLPSAGGLSHRLAYSEAQTPGDRTVGELKQATQEVKETLVAQTATGDTVTVPTIGTGTAAGIK